MEAAVQHNVPSYLHVWQPVLALGVLSLVRLITLSPTSSVARPLSGPESIARLGDWPDGEAITKQTCGIRNWDNMQVYVIGLWESVTLRCEEREDGD